MDTFIIKTLSQPVSGCSVVEWAVIVDVYIVVSSVGPEGVGKTAKQMKNNAHHSTLEQTKVSGS